MVFRMTGRSKTNNKKDRKIKDRKIEWKSIKPISIDQWPFLAIYNTIFDFSAFSNSAKYNFGHLNFCTNLSRISNPRAEFVKAEKLKSRMVEDRIEESRIVEARKSIMVFQPSAIWPIILLFGLFEFCKWRRMFFKSNNWTVEY